MKIRVGFGGDEDGSGVDGEVELEEGVPRKAKITKKYYERHGYTEGCEGCGRMRAGLAQRAHSDGCRKRMEEALRSDGDGKRLMEEATQREMEISEKKVKEDDERRKGGTVDGDGKDKGEEMMDGDGTNGTGMEREDDVMDVGRIVMELSLIHI